MVLTVKWPKYIVPIILTVRTLMMGVSNKDVQAF